MSEPDGTRTVIRLDDAGTSLVGDVDAIIRSIRDASSVVALTGAGVSVESGIPDFRSPGGLWERFDPFEYASLARFRQSPERSWQLFRALGRDLLDCTPNPAHSALAELEQAGIVSAVITQNIDGLHRAAGSRHVIEMHGRHDRLECLDCGHEQPLVAARLEPDALPRCPRCESPMKPTVVLFGEPVRDLGAVDEVLRGHTLLLAIGTSAEIAPASLIPERVRRDGGTVIEFNVEAVLPERTLGDRGARVLGPVGRTLPCLVARLIAPAPGGS